MSRSTRQPAQANRKGKSAGSTWVLDISQPVGDRIMDAAAFEKFLHDRIKIENKKPGQLGDKVKIEREGDAKIIVTTTIPFSKRYLKYLTKKHLKKTGTRDFLQVHASRKNEYKLSYLDKTAADDEDAD